MLIRMTNGRTADGRRRAAAGAALAAAALAAGALFAAGPAQGGSEEPPPVALVIDAPLARDGRELVDARLARLEHLDAAVRLPRTDAEARTDVRYLDALGYRVVVAGSRAIAAADGTGVGATRVAGLRAAVAEAR